MVVENEKLARDVAEQRKQELQENKFNQVVKYRLITCSARLTRVT